MIDRMLINHKKPQLYGSQTTIDTNGKPNILEIAEPEYVNQRRKSIGLGPIQYFLKKRKITWTIEQKEK